MQEYYALVTPMPLTAPIALADTTVSFDTTNFASSGVIYVDGDIISYTGKTATEITGVTGIDKTCLE